MVCVSGGCDGYHPMLAALIGFVSGPSYLGISRLMVRLQIDDPVDAVAIHLGGGREAVTNHNESFQMYLISPRIPRPHGGALPPHRRRVLQLGGPQYAPLQFRWRSRFNRILRNHFRPSLLLIYQVSERDESWDALFCLVALKCSTKDDGKCCQAQILLFDVSYWEFHLRIHCHGTAHKL